MLLASSLPSLRSLIRLFHSLCSQRGLTINASKSKLLANSKGLASGEVKVGEYMDLDGLVFELVHEFRYLGLVFDSRGGEKTMITRLVEKGRRCFGWLISFLNRNGWRHPHLRLVLFDVYVHSILQFGCSVWGPRLLVNGIEHSLILPLLAYHRKCIRALLGLDRRTHNCLVYILSARPPLKASLIK